MKAPHPQRIQQQQQYQQQQNADQILHHPHLLEHIHDPTDRQAGPPSTGALSHHLQLMLFAQQKNTPTA